MKGRRRPAAALAALGLVAGLALTSCSGGGGGADDVVLTVAPSASLLDEPATIRVGGLPGAAEATLAADAVDADGRAWHSSVVLRADDHGAIDTATAAAPPGGSYSGVFADGLIAMLRPTDGAAPASFAFPAAGPADFRFSVAMQGRQVATAVQQRSLADPQVTSTTLRSPDHGFDGVYLRPTDTSVRRPAVLLLGGSEGGNSQTRNAQLLAAHGVPALALAYFNAPGRPDEFPGLPKTLKDVPLEYFRGALAWLAVQPGVDARHLRVDGGSRGSEAALLVGIHFPDLVHGVAAVVPTDAARPALLAGGSEGRGDPDHSAWTFRGREVPWSTQVDAADRPSALFAVEKIAGPVLLVCGGADQIWPSCPAGRRMEARLAGAHFPFPHQLLAYDDGGHFVSRPANDPYVPDPGGLPVYGSTDQSNPLASADAWPKTLAFLQSR